MKKEKHYTFFFYSYIQIEQAFRLLFTKWHVFKKPFEVKFWQATLVVEAAFCLHNYGINENKNVAMIKNTCNLKKFTPWNIKIH